MSKTYRRDPEQSPTKQRDTINRMRGYRPLTHRAAEAMRERAFASVHANRQQAAR